MFDVSILTSVCGTGQWLGEMLLSLVQSDANYQVIIRANGSAETDTVDRLSMYVPQERRVVLCADETISLSDSLNEMIDCARGSWIMRLDPDDALPPGALESMIEAANEHGGQAVVYGAYMDHGGDCERIFEPVPATPQNLYSRNVAPYNYLMPARLLRDVDGWREVGFEDWDLMVRLMAAGGECVIVGEVTLYHRVRPDGLLAEYNHTAAERKLAIRAANRGWFEEAGCE